MSPTLNVKPPGPAAGTAAHRHRSHPAHLVVLGTLGLVAEHVVRRGDRLEPLLGGAVTRVLVGVEFAVRACGTPW